MFNFDWGQLNPTKAWEALKSEARVWAQKVVALNNASVPPELESEKARLLSSAKVIKNTIENIFGKLDFLNSAGLGAVPLVIPVVAVAGAAAAITKWTLDYNQFKAKLAEYQKLVNQGQTPGSAASIVSSIGQKAGMVASVTKFLPWAIVGFLAWRLMK